MTRKTEEMAVSMSRSSAQLSSAHLVLPPLNLVELIVVCLSSTS